MAALAASARVARRTGSTGTRSGKPTDSRVAAFATVSARSPGAVFHSEAVRAGTSVATLSARPAVTVGAANSGRSAITPDAATPAVVPITTAIGGDISVAPTTAASPIPARTRAAGTSGGTGTRAG
ncbi:hypothetical protein BHQ23_20830 [Mycobacterium gordonae]|uniref:Uncharacterized protein n=1 Tax=Mycobacterium gordonae TaxID=1778 RepID=A0A1X1VZ36_MYCGO|nr:hypothetical protein [Mycobacterium gordonae]ODR19043.1 hypothetical protein BHQ23_20830 [Mycobacterium gordonae]ORV75469.1 hypothetical protein AWC08_00670 [Mycobacterium gordonae]PJE03484.1 MAG: hypothetical protein CK428_28955 [Mycobacterium sp.]